MPIYNAIEVRDPSPSTYGFPNVGHVFAVSDPNEVLYEYLGHNALLLEARPVASPALKQVFTQEEMRALVRANKLDPRLEQNSDARRRVAARNPDIASGGDVSDEESAALHFYACLCRRIESMYRDNLTSKTDAALAKTIRKVMAELHFGIDGDDGLRALSQERGIKGRGRNKAKPKEAPNERRIGARKMKVSYDVPSPSTVRTWIRKLIELNWDELAIRDHRKGRCGNRAPKITEPHSLSIMSGWVKAYLDRNRPTMAVLYKLMIGAVDPDEVNQVRNMQGKAPLEVCDIETFAVANKERADKGLALLPIPSKSTFERAVRKLPKFDVCVARHGLQEARRRFKVAGRREAALRAGERVAIDSWRFQLALKTLPKKAWADLPDAVVASLEGVRLNFTGALCEATKVVLGARLSANADSETVLRTLEMVCKDKTAIAQAAGCRSAWSQACTPESVPTDSGSENIAASVRWAIRDIGSSNEIGPASHPDARPAMERFFGTLDMQFSQFFQGRTFAGVGDKGDYNPTQVLNVLVEVLQEALVRYIVDVYHNTPHAGLGGQTPNEAWAEKSALYGVLPPPKPALMRAVFGFADNRRIQNRGLRFLGLWFRSERLAKLRLKIGQADIRIRADLEDLRAVSVSENKPGAEWFEVPCDTPMEGVSAAEWIEATNTLARHHANVAKLSEPIVLAALRDLRAKGLRSALEAGIGPSTMSRDEILKQEKLHLNHFGIVPAEARGLTFDEFDDDGVLLENAGEVPVDPDDATDGDEQRPVTRRRGRLRSDFLGGE